MSGLQLLLLGAGIGAALMFLAFFAFVFYTIWRVWRSL